MAERLLTTRQVCERWGIHRVTLYRQLQAGTIRVPPAALVGKRLRWREAEIERDIATSSLMADTRKALREGRL